MLVKCCFFPERFEIQDGHVHPGLWLAETFLAHLTLWVRERVRWAIVTTQQKTEGAVDILPKALNTNPSTTKFNEMKNKNWLKIKILYVLSNGKTPEFVSLFGMKSHIHMAHQYHFKMNILQILHSNWMNNKIFKIFEICTFRSLSDKFISETVKDGGNPSTYCRKLSIQFI
jgi:hypothetical protein